MNRTSDQDVIEHNRNAWNRSVAEKDLWTIPVDEDVIARARRDDWSIILTPVKAVPRAWFGDLRGKKVLALASGGGQQAPVLAAAGADVTVFDLSEAQLKQDEFVARREGLDLTLVQGRADDLGVFADASFDLIVNPVSNCFFPDLRPVWRECARVLRAKGTLMTGFINPIQYAFDFEKANVGHFELRYTLPYSDTGSLTLAEQERFLHSGTPREFSHTLTEQIGGLIDAGFAVDGFYEDIWHNSQPIDRFLPVFIAMKATRKA